MMELFYNPERMSETEVKETFVANQWLVDEILSIVKQQPKGAGVQHALIIAPRGMGKTTVLLMLRFSVLESELAQSGQPVLFPEESYAVYDLADFWLSGLGHLAADTDDEELNARVSELQCAHKDGERLEEAALATIKDWRSQSKKQILMLVDSFDDILSQIGDERDNAKLREVLMNDGTMMLVGGATTFFKEARDYDQPLYNLFKTYNLENLDSNQIHELLRRRAMVDGVENFDEQLRRNASRLRVLEYFTGGNPRLVMMLYRVITRSDVSEVRSGIEKLLDEVTPYYKSKIENLPPQQRKLMDHIARISSRTSEGLTPTEIATSTRLTPNQVSAQLKRLADIGYVRAANVRGRKSYYTLSEPLYAIWHQMRFGREARERMNWLVTFLKGWYGTEELNSECARLRNSFNEYLASGRLSEACDALECRGYLIAALEHNLGKLTTNQRTTPIKDQYLADVQLAESAANVELARGALINNRADEAITHFRRAIELNPMSIPAQFGLAMLLKTTGNIDEALKKFETAEQSVSRNSPIVNVLRAFRGAVENNFDVIEESLSTVPPNTGVTIWFMVGLVFTGSSDLDAALKSFSRVIELEPDHSEAWYWQARMLYALDRYEETLTSVDASLRISPRSFDALDLRGVILAKLLNHAEALISFDRALEIEPGASKTWHSRGLVLFELKRNEEALSSIERACELEPDFYDALLARGAILTILGRFAEANSTIEAVLKIEPDSFDALYLRGLISLQETKNIDRIKSAFKIGSGGHALMRDTCEAQFMKFLVSLEEQNLPEAKQDWLRFDAYLNNEPDKAAYLEIAASALRDLAAAGHWDLVRELIADSRSGDPWFPLARALDYLTTGSDELIEKLSPEVRKIVEEIVDTLGKSAGKTKANKKSARTTKRRRT